MLNLLCTRRFFFSFVAQNNEELSFVKGERLEILDRPPADPDWFRARNTNGSIGLIPKNYVQVIMIAYLAIKTKFDSYNRHFFSLLFTGD